MIKTSIKKPSQHCSDAITDQKKILETLKESPVYFPQAIKRKESLVNFTQSSIQRLRDSVKFHVPYGGNILIEMINEMPFKEAVNNYLKQFRLPFPSIALEYDFEVDENNSEFIENNLPYKASIILIDEQLREGQNPILIARMLSKIYSPTSNKFEWHSLPYDVAIDLDKCAIDDRFSYFTEIIPINDQYLMEHNHKDFINDTTNEFGVIIQFLIAMSCNNVSSQAEPPPSMMDNKKRQKKGLEKNYQYRTIVINTKNGSKSEVGKSSGSKGSSKSEHLRRGHLRHYEDKNIWIEQTVVNANKGSKPSPKNYKMI